MYPKTHDYSFLLDDLRIAYNNYYLNQDDTLVDNNNKKIEDRKLAINLKFSLLYCLCFKKLYEIHKDKTVNPNEYIFQALTNYHIFNSFMNICIREYQMYGDVGTGKVVYYPYEQIIHFFTIDYEKKNMLKAYLNSEMDNIINIQQNNIKTLKK